jgi:Zn-dependent peptidase ImmA (M78 family)/plasmid maintenance system antidote protein VapI
MASILKNDTLKLARNYFGLNQKEFARKLDISQALVSNLEKSLKPLTEDIIEKLKDEFGETFFSQVMSTPNLKVHYRASATVAKKYTDLFEARLLIISNKIEQLLEYVEIPENKIPQKNLEDFQLDSEYLANEVRDYFGLGRKPIEDIVKLLETNGVIVYFFDYDFISEQNKSFDGVSFYVKGVPVILVNDKIQNARKVFTLAHELCHLIIHNHNDFFISNERDMEKEANKFASEFLAPKSALRGEFTRLSTEKLFELKAYWKISVGALLYKAKETTLTQDQYRRWVTFFAPYRKKEPQDISINKPVLLKKMFQVCQEDIGSETEFFDEFGISKKIFEDVYSTLIDKERTKLKIIL